MRWAWLLVLLAACDETAEPWKVGRVVTGGYLREDPQERARVDGYRFGYSMCLFDVMERETKHASEMIEDMTREVRRADDVVRHMLPGP